MVTSNSLYDASTEPTSIPSYGFLSEKFIQKASNRIVGKKQNLQVSDFEAFLQQLKEKGRMDYPSCFKFIKIDPMSDKILNEAKKEDVFGLNCTRIQLINLSVDIIMENSFAKKNLNYENLTLLVAEIADNYHSVSYHNFTHGFSLSQMLYKCFKIDANLRSVYSDQDLTYYLIAGLAHDINHKGTNNGYEQKMKSALAVEAQNSAVLEKMHLKTFLAITRSKPEFDIISKSRNPLLTKQKITRAILGTDMAKHFKKVKCLEETRNTGNLDFKNEQIQTMFMQNLFHACDIGNSLLPADEFLTWGSLLSYEFHEQTKLEADNSVAVSEFMVYRGLSSFFESRIGFIEKLVFPIWKQISISFSGIETLLLNCERNLAILKEMRQKEQG